MPYNLPHIGNSADESFYVNLEGVKYEIRMRWNTRDEAWWCYIGYEGLDATLITKFTAGANILLPYRAREGVPSGALFLNDTESIVGRPSRDDTGINKRFKMLYLTQDEYQEVF